MIFRKNFPAESMNFLNISHGENTEVQKGHRAAPDFSILAAWRHQGKVAAKIESYQKMKRYRENQEAAGNQATAEKPGGFGKAKGGGGPYWVPPPPLQKERCAISRGLAAEGALPPKGPCRRRGYAAKGLRRQGATPPRGYAAEGLCYQGALPPRGCAAKGLCRQGLLSPKRSAAKGGIRPGASYRPPERLRPERPRS